MDDIYLNFGSKSHTSLVSNTSSDKTESLVNQNVKCQSRVLKMIRRLVSRFHQSE